MSNLNKNLKNFPLLKEGEYYYIQDENGVRLAHTNPKDTRFPYLVMPSKKQEVERLAFEKYPVDMQPNGKTIAGGIYEIDVNWSARQGFLQSFNANPAKKYTKEDIMAWYKHVKTHTCQEAFEHLDKSLQPTAKAVRVEMIDNGQEEWMGSDADGEPFWVEKWEIKVEQSTEYSQGIVRAIEVIY